MFFLTRFLKKCIKNTLKSGPYSGLKMYADMTPCKERI